jgi:polysaccharide biosynthesis protein PslH
VRYTPITKRLSDKFNVDVSLVVDEPHSISESDALEAGVRSVDVLVRTRGPVGITRRVRSRLASLTGLTVPATIFRYDKAEIISRFYELARKEYEIVIVSDSTLAGLARKAFPRCRMVVDAIDSRYLLYTRSARQSWIAHYEGRQLWSWERAIADYADCVTYISEYDRQTIYGSRHRKNVVVIPNGVFDEDYVPSCGERDSHTIVYLGHMGYRPNVIAAQTAAQILQSVRREVPEAKLQIVGRSPTEEVLALARMPGVEVTGAVPSIWPFLSSATVCLFPMVEGAGQQNKLLEAMRAAAPVVTTSVGNLGVGARPGFDLCVAEGYGDLAREVVGLLKDQALAQSIGRNGRLFVERNFTWEESWQKIECHWLRGNGN